MAAVDRDAGLRVRVGRGRGGGPGPAPDGGSWWRRTHTGVHGGDAGCGVHQERARRRSAAAYYLHRAGPASQPGGPAGPGSSGPGPPTYKDDRNEKLKY
jgi:hypothetical protein